MPSTVSFTVRANITGTSEVHVGVLWFLGSGYASIIALVIDSVIIFAVIAGPGTEEHLSLFTRNIVFGPKAD